jgi:hypothetical protein
LKTRGYFAVISPWQGSDDRYYYTGAEVTETNVSESFTHWSKNRATQVDRVFFKVMPQAARNAAGELNVLD